MENNIKHLREKKGISQRELARRLGISHTHMNRLERGGKRPNVPLSVRISQELDCTLDDIFLHRM